MSEKSGSSSDGENIVVEVHENSSPNGQPQYTDQSGNDASYRSDGSDFFARNIPILINSSPDNEQPKSKRNSFENDEGMMLQPLPSYTPSTSSDLPSTPMNQMLRNFFATIEDEHEEEDEGPKSEGQENTYYNEEEDIQRMLFENEEIIGQNHPEIVDQNFSGNEPVNYKTASIHSMKITPHPLDERVTAKINDSLMFPQENLPIYWKFAPKTRPALWCIRMLGDEEKDSKETAPLFKKNEMRTTRYMRSLSWWQKVTFFASVAYTIFMSFFVVNRYVNFPFNAKFIFNTCGAGLVDLTKANFPSFWTGMILSFPLLPAVIYAWVYPVLGFYTQFIRFMVSKCSSVIEFNRKKIICVSTQSVWSGLILVAAFVLPSFIVILLELFFAESIKLLDDGSESHSDGITAIKYIYPILMAVLVVVFEEISHILLKFALYNELKLYPEEFYQSLTVHTLIMKIVTKSSVTTILGMDPTGYIGWYPIVYITLNFVIFEIIVFNTRWIEKRAREIGSKGEGGQRADLPGTVDLARLDTVQLLAGSAHDTVNDSIQALNESIRAINGNISTANNYIRSVTSYHNSNTVRLNENIHSFNDTTRTINQGIIAINKDVNEANHAGSEDASHISSSVASVSLSLKSINNSIANLTNIATSVFKESSKYQSSYHSNIWNNPKLGSIGIFWKFTAFLIGYNDSTSVDAAETFKGTVFLFNNLLDLFLIGSLSPVAPLLVLVYTLAEIQLLSLRVAKMGKFVSILPSFSIDNIGAFVIVAAGLLLGASNLGLSAAYSLSVGGQWGLLLEASSLAIPMALLLIVITDRNSRILKIEKAIWFGIILAYIFEGVNLAIGNSAISNSSEIFGNFLMIPTYFWWGGITVLFGTWTTQLVLTVFRTCGRS